MPQDDPQMNDDPKRELLRHMVATVVFRGRIALADAPSDFAEFRVTPETRSPAEILAHIGDLLVGTRILLQGDFVELAKTVDPYIEQTGALAGILIETPSFPGWESLGAMAAHLRFVRDHHEHIQKVGLVTDSALGKVAEQLASHFVSAEIRHFPVGQLDAAKQWVINRP